jgi:hypothetical protein
MDTAARQMGALDWQMVLECGKAAGLPLNLMRTTARPFKPQGEHK